MNVIDSGIPVLSMHAPYEVISKVDLYEGYRGYCARSFRAPSRWNKTPSVCLFNAFRLPSAANLRRFSSADSATGGADFKRPSERKFLFLV